MSDGQKLEVLKESKDSAYREGVLGGAGLLLAATSLLCDDEEERTDLIARVTAIELQLTRMHHEPEFTIDERIKYHTNRINVARVAARVIGQMITKGEFDI